MILVAWLHAARIYTHNMSVMEPIVMLTLQHPMSLLKPNASLLGTEQEPLTTKSMRHGLSARLA